MAAVRAVRIEQESPRAPDVLALIAALDAFLGAIYPAASNHFLDLDTLRRPEVRFFVARAESAAVGCGALWVRPDRGYGEVKRMFVRPEARGMRIGARLLEAIVEEARREGLAVLRLETGVRSEAALGLYRAVGFAERGPFGEYGADANSVFMERGV